MHRYQTRNLKTLGFTVSLDLSLSHVGSFLWVPSSFVEGVEQEMELQACILVSWGRSWERLPWLATLKSEDFHQTSFAAPLFVQ